MEAVFAKRHSTTTYGNTYATLTGAYGAAAETTDKLIKLFGTLTGHLRTLTGLQKNWACCMTHVRPHLRETLTGAYGTAAGIRNLSSKSAWDSNIAISGHGYMQVCVDNNGFVFASNASDFC